MTSPHSAESGVRRAGEASRDCGRDPERHDLRVGARGALGQVHVLLALLVEAADLLAHWVPGRRSRRVGNCERLLALTSLSQAKRTGVGFVSHESTGPSLLGTMGSVEATIRALWDGGELRSAATEAIETYGPEVLGWLTTSTGDPSEADEAFGAACEDLWRGLGGFRWECSVRAWFYTLARHALIRGRKRAAERPERRQALESVEVAALARSRTAPWLRTEVKDVFQRLREELSEEERELLVLRVDRNLAWEEIAIILGDGGASVAATSARLRKRFQAIKHKLRERARSKGLLGEDG